jgi:hypothetical protein
MAKLNSEEAVKLSLMEMVIAIRENTNVIQKNIKEVRKLSVLLAPTLKESELLKLKQSEDKNLLRDCIKTISNSHG